MYLSLFISQWLWPEFHLNLFSGTNWTLFSPSLGFIGQINEGEWKKIASGDKLMAFYYLMIL